MKEHERIISFQTNKGLCVEACPTALNRCLYCPLKGRDCLNAVLPGNDHNKIKCPDGFQWREAKTLSAQIVWNYIAEAGVPKDGAYLWSGVDKNGDSVVKEIEIKDEGLFQELGEEIIVYAWAELPVPAIKKATPAAAT